MASLEDTTTTGRRARNPVSYTYPDSDDEEESLDERPAEAANDDASVSNANDDSNNNAEPRRVKPVVRGYSNKENMDEFQSVDGDKIFEVWAGRRYLHWCARGAFRAGERSLVAVQDQHYVELEPKFNSEVAARISQVPYHPDMLPFYEYFSEGIQQKSDIETFRIANYHLPPSPWLGDSIIPVLEMNSNNRGYEGNMTTLELSNCSLSADDLTSLTKFLAGNTTLLSLNISRSNIESVDTAKALAKAIKKHPRLGHVGLAYCSLGSGNHDVLAKILVACKQCVSLEIGHNDFDSEGVASIAKFLGRKNALTSFSLMGAPVDKENKALLTKSIVKNKTLEELCLRSNGLQLPGILRNTKKITESLSRLTHLDLSYNALPVQGARIMAKFLEEADSSLTTLIMSKNNITTKGANILLPALKENTTLQHLDLSRNWLTDAAAPVVIDALKNNSTLLTFDLSGNKSMKAKYGGCSRYVGGGNWETTPRRDGGRSEVVKGALFDTTSLEAIGNSNHTCAVTMSGNNHGQSYEDTIHKINTLDVCEGKKIRYKVLLALNEVNKELYDPRSFNDVPLELMPYLLELVQQKVKYDRHEVVLKPNNRTHSLGRLYEIISDWQSLPLLFVRGAGKLKRKKKAAKSKKGGQPKRRKRKRFGDDDDDDDEPFIPKGARKRIKWVWNPETRRYDRIQEWQVGGNITVV